MSVFVDLVELYENGGLAVQTSLSPAHFPGFNLAEIPFTYLFGEDGPLCKGGGIALAEISFFEALCERTRPRRVFVIGNAFGWSTLALSLINPSARIVAIDHCPRVEEERGIAVTNALARAAGLDATAVKGKSPDEVASICAAEFDGPIDLAFIDGGHTPEQQKLDFDACRSVASDDCVYVFHDVINFGMVQSFVEITLENPDLAGSLLLRTPSGMGICYPTPRSAAVGPVVRAFTEPEARVRALREEGRRRQAGLTET